MARKRSMQASLIFVWAAILLFQNLGIFVVCEVNSEYQKNFFFPDPNARTPPTVPYTPPAVSHTPPAGGYGGSPPSHGGGSYGGSPPSHGGGSSGGSPPSQGGRSYGGSPPHCGNPPSGGADHHPTPSPPTGGGGGEYHHSPPTSTATPTPTITLSPPTTPIFMTPPSSPSPFDPNSPPFNCTYWKNHPTLVWAVFGWFGTVGNAFGVSSTTPGVGAQASLLQALSNTRTDGYGGLYREGTAALLNSMAHTKYPYTTTHVRDSFVAALSSNKAATAQAQLFKLANEGRIKGRD